MEVERFKVWWSRLSRLVIGVCFGAGVGFFIEGYHFRIFYARVRKLGWRSLFFCRMGYFYNLLLVLPLHVRVFWRKRSFFLRGAFLSSFIALCFYLRMLRNLFPYKIKGVIYDNDRMARKNYEETLFSLKPGKQDKQKQQR